MPALPFFRTLCLLLLLGLVGTSNAAELASLQTSNQAPLTAIFATPTSASAKLLDSGQSSWGIQIDSASVYSKNTKRNEAIEQDGEFVSVLLHYQKALSTKMQLSIYLPWRYQSGGFADSMVDSWHGFFNLPEGGRDTAPKDRLFIRYQRQSQDQLVYQDIASGFMDARLRLSHQLSSSANRYTSLSGELKLNNGNSKTLLGSGGLALSLFSDTRWQTPSSPWSLQARIGAQYRQTPDLLAAYHKTWLGLANAAIAYRFNDRWYTQWQLELSSAQYDSKLEELGASAQLSFGLSYLSRLGQLDVMVSEDVAVASTPDVALHIAWRQHVK